MTKKERKYLRALFHHFDDRQIRHTATPDYSELAKEWRKFKVVLKATFLILAIEGDTDDETIPQLDELFNEHGIEFIKK